MTPEQFRQWLDEEVDKFSPIPERKKGISEKTWDFIILQAGTERVGFELGATAAYNLLTGDDGWIRVEDGLPQPGLDVWVFYENCGGDRAHIVTGDEIAILNTVYHTRRFSSGVWWHDPEMFSPIKHVTHWRPLPEAPKK